MQGDNPGVASAQPKTAINANGDKVAIWYRTDEISYYGIYASASIDGGTIKRLSSGSASDPRVALDDDGNAVAVWQAFDPASNSSAVWSSQYDVRNSSWNTAAIIPSMTDVKSAQLAGNAAGVVLAVVETEDNSSQTNVYAEHFITKPSARLGVIGSWVYDQPLNFTQDSVTAPQVAVDTDGNGMAVWVQIDHNNTQMQKIWASYYDASTSTWESSELIDNPTTGYWSSEPQIAFGPSGKAIAVWSQADDINSPDKRIWSNQYTPGQGWGKPVPVETGTGYASTEPQVKIGGNGTAVCVWTRTANGLSRILASRF